MTAVAGVNPTPLGEFPGNTADAAEPAKRLSQHLLVLIDVGYVEGHGDEFVKQLCHNVRQGLAPRTSRVVLVFPPKVGRAVKETFRRTMAPIEHEAKLASLKELPYVAPSETLPFHAMMYAPNKPLSYDPSRGHDNGIEPGTEAEQGLLMNGLLDFNPFRHSTNPDVVLVADELASIQWMRARASDELGIGGRRWKGILYTRNNQGTGKSIEWMPNQIASQIDAEEDVVTLSDRLSSA